jgi:hypothetical protein
MEIYYQFEDDLEAPPATETSSVPPSAPQPATPTMVAFAPVAPPSIIVASVEDVAIKAMEVLWRKSSRRE